jgi:ribonuclease HII
MPRARRPAPDVPTLFEAETVSFEIGEIESWARARGIDVLLGVDEAGKGPFAGPVAAAAVVLPASFSLPGLRDSKRLSEADRERLYPLIIAQALGYGIALEGADIIDANGLQPATHRAMHRAIAAALETSPKVGMVVVDGKNLIPGVAHPQRAVVKGDDRCYAVAAASVLAKVTRDRHMVEQDALWPVYGFRIHKGYGTEAHRAALREHGPCPIHRRSFKGVVPPPSP